MKSYGSTLNFIDLKNIGARIAVRAPISGTLRYWICSSVCSI
jgi:hypothetical protein